jgi:hypothetical protein
MVSSQYYYTCLEGVVSDSWLTGLVCTNERGKASLGIGLSHKLVSNLKSRDYSITVLDRHWITLLLALISGRGFLPLLVAARWYKLT